MKKKEIENTKDHQHHWSDSTDEVLVKTGEAEIRNLDGETIRCDVYAFPEASLEQGLSQWNFGRNTPMKICQDMVKCKHIKLLHFGGLWWLSYEETPTRTGTGPFGIPEAAIGWFERSGR